jgi:hypothetical protein
MQWYMTRNLKNFHILRDEGCALESLTSKYKITDILSVLGVPKPPIIQGKEVKGNRVNRVRRLVIYKFKSIYIDLIIFDFK